MSTLIYVYNAYFFVSSIRTGYNGNLDFRAILYELIILVIGFFGSIFQLLCIALKGSPQNRKRTKFLLGFLQVGFLNFVTLLDLIIFQNLCIRNLMRLVSIGIYLDIIEIIPVSFYCIISLAVDLRMLSWLIDDADGFEKISRREKAFWKPWLKSKVAVGVIGLFTLI